MKKIDILTVAGVVLGSVLVLWGILMGSPIGAFINWPGMVIVLGGSTGALLVSFPMEQIKQVAKVTMQALFENKRDVGALAESFAGLAQRARREGLLALEDDLEELEDPFMRNGLQMVIDGFEPESIRDIMETDIRSLGMRHTMGQNVFRTWGGIAPAFGMIGTLIGLVQMLTSLDDPEMIGPGMAVALLTTFYGTLLANLVLNPIAAKLAIRSEAEMSYREAIVDSLLALQAGVNPRIVQEKLKAYLSPQERNGVEEKKPADAQAVSEEM